ncbi:MAG: peroxiredoxin [Rhizobiales bacterium]|nr:peroxiredoxin [Hyphomicrobiales bacterium]
MTDNSLAQRGDMLTINMPAPDFVARTTMGERRLSSYRGRWLVLFSHPADFTPVCTSEFIAFAGLQASFADIGCDLLALSVDSLYSHVAWVRSIRDRFGVGVNFPIAEDPSMAIAAAYGMIPPDAGDSSTVRASFVIDPDGIVRAITWYPMAVGRNVSEILRLVVALQTSDAHAVSTPEGWQPGQPVIDAAPLDPEGETGPYDWYYKLKTL